MVSYIYNMNYNICKEGYKHILESIVWYTTYTLAITSSSYIDFTSEDDNMKINLSS